MLLRCSSLVLSVIAYILEFSHRREEILQKYLPKCRQLFHRFLLSEDPSLYPHTFYLAHLYKNLLSILSRADIIDREDARGTLKVNILYFVYIKTLDEGMYLLARYSSQKSGQSGQSGAQSGGNVANQCLREIIKEEDLYVMIVKIFEGYSYNPRTLKTLYIFLCNLATEESFLDKLGKLKIFHYSLIHAHNNWRQHELVNYIFRFLKYILRNGQLTEMFFNACLELLNSMELNLPSLAAKIGQDLKNNQKEASNGAVVEILSVLGLGCRNNRKFEVALTQEKDFCQYVKELAEEKDLSEDMVDVLAGLPLEDILLSS